MSSSRTSSYRVVADHFEPDDAMDPKTQRALRGQLEQIDYAAYTANKTVMGAIGRVDLQKFEALALATAKARALWVATGLAAGVSGQPPTTAKIAELAQLRAAYEELTEVYDGLRRMVERGYVAYAGA